MEDSYQKVEIILEIFEKTADHRSEVNDVCWLHSIKELPRGSLIALIKTFIIRNTTKIC